MIELDNYRLTRRKDYILKTRPLIDAFISSFIIQQNDQEIHSMLNLCLELAYLDPPRDYIEYREKLRELIDKKLRAKLIKSLNDETWYNPTFISVDFLIEKCVSHHIMDCCNERTKVQL